MGTYQDADEVECERVEPELNAFSNDYGDVTITLEFPEFSHVCPVTGRPDNGELTVEYEPEDLILEEKSFRDYLYEYDNKGIWHEAAAVDIKQHIVDAIDPKSVSVTIAFKARGGIYTTVESEYEA
jgi:7-cyano-7-deazaguanine reductase